MGFVNVLINHLDAPLLRIKRHRTILNRQQGLFCMNSYLLVGVIDIVIYDFEKLLLHMSRLHNVDVFGTNVIHDLFKAL
jgi:hypothetical protein